MLRLELLCSCWYCVGLQMFWSWIHLGREQLLRWVGCAALWRQEGQGLCVLPGMSSQSPGHGKS